VLQFLRVFGPARNLQPHYNIAPTMTVDVIRLDESGNRELVPMRWGLIPAWWVKSLKEIPATFNARAESVADKPMFRDAFKAKRCIIPASGFYEWTGDKGDRQPHLFTPADGSLILASAGLWDRWRDRATGEESRIDPADHISTRQYARLVDEWATGIGLRREDYGTHSLRRTKASIIYKQTGNLRAVQILFGHTKIESTVRYLGVDIEDALALAEGTEV
jgi:hypothetical protein